MNQEQSNKDYKKLYYKYKNKYLEIKKLNEKTDENKIFSNNYLAKSNLLNDGYGVFANKSYKKNEIVKKTNF